MYEKEDAYQDTPRSMKGGTKIELALRNTENYKIEIEQLDKSNRTPTQEEYLS